jgi:uncharacterized membrane protein
MKVLYAGDSPVGGPANYLLGILKFLRADYVHLPPAEVLRPQLFKRNFDAIVLSDYSKKQVPAASEKLIRDQVRSGTGLLMVGGWGSFSGPFGRWRGSAVERLLPVTCARRDDRVNFPGGALAVVKQNHPVLRSLPFREPPVICGLNRIRPKKGARVVLVARRVLFRSGRPFLEVREYPLLVIDSLPGGRVAALATDLAPHWCGGLVDWGKKKKKILIRKGISVEIGDQYVRFVGSLLKWLAGTA